MFERGFFNFNYKDFFVWLRNNLGQFLVKFMSFYFMESKVILVFDVAKGVWRGFVFYKIEIFVWMVVLERLKIQDRLIKIRVIDFEDGDCVFCGNSR